MRRELFGSGPTVGDISADGKTLGGARAEAVGVCALARSDAAVYGAEAAQESVEGRGNDPGEGMERGHGLLSREVGGIGPRPRIEGIPISTYAVPIPLDGL